jgi:hypothetical protein
MTDWIVTFVLVSFIPLSSSVAIYQQCGGSGYTGSTNCDWPLGCFRRSQWFSSCQTSCPGGDWECATGAGYSSGAGLARAWEQCGGEGWNGPRGCSQYPCQWRSKWYAQCRPDCPVGWICQGTGSSSTGTPTHSTTGTTEFMTSRPTTSYEDSSEENIDETTPSYESSSGENIDETTPSYESSSGEDIDETTPSYESSSGEDIDETTPSLLVDSISDEELGLDIIAQMLGSTAHDEDIHPMEMSEIPDLYDAVVDHIINIAEIQEPGSIAQFGAALQAGSIEQSIDAWVNMRDRLEMIAQSPELRTALLLDPAFAGQLQPKTAEDRHSNIRAVKVSKNPCFPEIPNIGRVNGLYGDGIPTAMDVKDAALAGAMIVGGKVAVASLLASRGNTLRRVEKGQLTVDPESRLGAYYATRGQDICTVGHSVHVLIGGIYMVFGTAGEEKIGRVFNDKTVQSLFKDPVSSTSSECVGHIEYRYWENVEKEDKGSFGGLLGARAEPHIRDSLQKFVGWFLCDLLSK